MAFGPGRGSRLLAPGLPEVIVVSDDALVGERVMYLGAARGPRGSRRQRPSCRTCRVQGKTCIAWRTESGFRISAGVAAKGVEIPGARGVHVGVDWAVVDHGIERRVLCLADNSTPIVPVGARDARPKAWSADAASPGLMVATSTDLRRVKTHASQEGYRERSPRGLLGLTGQRSSR